MSGTREKEDDATSELESPIWSVISFERCEAPQKTYAEAIGIIAELEAKGISGLCIVTDEAASRVTD